MQFIVTWSIAPGNVKAAAEAFIKGGAPAPEGMKILGRWHAPGSGKGWLLIESDDMTAVSQHMLEWNHLLCLDVTPVVGDEVAGEAMGRVYG